jgi:nucleotide-binding universal stress UspA family protein
MNSTPLSFEQILVPVDYSSHSRVALNAALALAQRFGSTLEVVHVWDRPSYVTDTLMVRHQGDVKPLGELIRENAEGDMGKFLAEALPPNPGVPLHRTLLSGEPVSTLLQKIREGGHGLVVVGTHGRTGLRHALLGSVAERLVRLSPVPVLTVPRGES